MAQPYDFLGLSAGIVKRDDKPICIYTDNYVDLGAMFDSGYDFVPGCSNVRCWYDRHVAGNVAVCHQTGYVRWHLAVQSIRSLVVPDVPKPDRRQWCRRTPYRPIEVC